ncbi:MAG TPA: metal-dependent hydrolase [Thermoanaerobaculia bacterium]|nr:metal-dependent hydrolase [Thermoanaerobaculia bacterium]
MDPLTHTLVGANLAATRLGMKTRLASAALVIGANLPDVDSIYYFTGQSDFALGFRRGWTHGVLALVVLPFVLTALLLAYARVRPDARRADPRALLALSALAILTHPFLDWLNNYGMRWLMPFRGTWFYGDSVFIADPWLWLILGGAWLAGRKRTPLMFALWAAFTMLVVLVVGGRMPVYLPVVGAVSIALLLVLVWQPRRSFAALGLMLAFAYIGARLTIHALTARAVQQQLHAERLMVAPHPFDPTRWDVVAQTGDVYRFGHYSWRRGGLALDPDRLPLPKPSPEWEAAQRDPSIRGFMTWVRFPWCEIDGTRVYIHDARYATRRTQRGFGGVVVTVPR